jgi:hypothetical protein
MSQIRIPVDEMIDVSGCGGNAVDEEGEEAQNHHHSHKFTQARQWDPTSHIIPIMLISYLKKDHKCHKECVQRQKF